MIDRITIDKIMDAAQIVDVVSEFVTLKKAGVNYKGLCPFHNDRTPSFVVSPSKGLCKCFSCGKGGNSVHFIMEHEQVSYYEALKYLAHKYHIEVKERELSDEEKKAQGERESMFVVNEFAKDFFQDILYNNVDGRAIGMQYFRSRGFRDDIIKKFQLGFSPNQADALLKAAREKGYKDEYLEKTGLCYKKDNGTLHDRFWGRVIFPVHTISGKVVAFGGRVLDSATKGVKQKYVNSPESSIYEKRRELYGIFQAKHSIVREDRCFLVEGYTDVISMHQCGIENVVASSGTALTTDQIRLIHRFTQNITVLYDGDDAGIHASLRGIDMLLTEGMDVKVLLLPDGDDPDSFARKHNSTEYQEYIDKNQVDFIKFKTNLLLKDAGDDTRKKAEVVDSIVRSIAVIPDEIARALYIKECSQSTGFEEHTLINTLNKIKQNSSHSTQKNDREEGEEENTQPSITEHNGNKLDAYEKNIAKIIIRFGEQTICMLKDEDGTNRPFTVCEYINHELTSDNISLENAIYKRVIDESLEYIHEEGFDCKKHFINHPDQDISKLAAELSSDQYQLSKYHGKTKKIVDDSERLMTLSKQILIEYKCAIIDIEAKNTLAQIQEASKNGDNEQMFMLMKNYKEITQTKNALTKTLGERVISF